MKKYKRLRYIRIWSTFLKLPVKTQIPMFEFKLRLAAEKLARWFVEGENYV